MREEERPEGATQPGDALRAWMERFLDEPIGPIAPARLSEYRAITAAVAELMTSGTAAWRGLPAIVADVLGARGFAWNGIYRLRTPDVLELCAAAGPPVCATIERRGGVGRSGMCFDAILMNQTIACPDVKSWPGYVSCDNESGLETKAGLCCPVRDGSGRPIGVWDVDATRDLDPGDPTYFDRLIATMSAVLAIDELPPAG